jgi:hypothetical protein
MDEGEVSDGDKLGDSTLTWAGQQARMVMVHLGGSKEVER